MGKMKWLRHRRATVTTSVHPAKRIHDAHPDPIRIVPLHVAGDAGTPTADALAAHLLELPISLIAMAHCSVPLKFLRCFGARLGRVRRVPSLPRLTNSLILF